MWGFSVFAFTNTPWYMVLMTFTTMASPALLLIRPHGSHAYAQSRPNLFAFTHPRRQHSARHIQEGKCLILVCSRSRVPALPCGPNMSTSCLAFENKNGSSARILDWRKTAPYHATAPQRTTVWG